MRWLAAMGLEGRETFTRATLRLRHLDVWAQLPGMTGEVVEDGSRATVTHQRPDEEAVELSHPAGRLVLDSVLTWSCPKVRGARLARTAELRWQGPEPG